MSFEDLQKELRTQDNRGTSNPIWEVRDLKRIPTSEDYSDKWRCYIDDWDFKPTKKNFIELADDWGYYDEKGNLSKKDFKKLSEQEMFEVLNDFDGEDNVLSKYYYIEEMIIKAIFLTEKEADNYIIRHKHNLTNPITYVSALKYSNFESDNSLILIRNLLLKGELITKREQLLKVQELIKNAFCPICYVNQNNGTVCVPSHDRQKYIELTKFIKLFEVREK